MADRDYGYPTVSPLIARRIENMKLKRFANKLAKTPSEKAQATRIKRKIIVYYQWTEID